MRDFQFKTPGNIIFKAGSSTNPETYRALAIKEKVLLICDATLVKLGIVDRVKNAIMETGVELVIYDQVEPEPKASSVRKLVDFARNENVEYIIGLGGGSPMDVAKIAALIIPSPQTIESMYGVGNAKGKRLPLLLIPTTAGTGSEGTPVAVVTGYDGEKSPIVGPQLICDTVILDAELTLELPPSITAATGADAMVHAIEAYSSGVRKNPVSDQLALNALKLLFKNIKIVMANGNNIEARGNMLMGSMMAGLAFANASVGAIHALAYPLGTQFQLSHGESNAIAMVPVMKYNLPEAETLYAQLCRAVIDDADMLDDTAASQQLINEIEKLIPDLGLKNRLSQYGIAANDLDSISKGALNQSRLLSYNIKAMSGEEIYNVLESIL